MYNPSGWKCNKVLKNQLVEILLMGFHCKANRRSSEGVQHL